MDKLKALCRKYREFLSYVFFGVLTTVVNYVSYLLLAPLFSTTTIPTAIAWALSVIFAYVTNRIFVFRSQAREFRALALGNPHLLRRAAPVRRSGRGDHVDFRRQAEAQRQGGQAGLQRLCGDFQLRCQQAGHLPQGRKRKG